MPRPSHHRIMGPRARELRRQPTVSELRLWGELKGKQLGYRFRRQVPIGIYIVDFACLGRRLVVEADGADHYWREADGPRDEYLMSLGHRVLRFSNREIAFHLDDVVATIRAYLDDLTLE